MTSGKALSQGAVVVNLGEFQILKRQVYQTRDDIVFADAVRLEILQQSP